MSVAVFKNSLCSDNKIIFPNFLKIFLYNHDPGKSHIKDSKELKIPFYGGKTLGNRIW